MARTPDRKAGLLADVRALAEQHLAPHATAIDTEARYPAAALRALGTAGAFAAALPASQGGQGLDLAAQAAVIDAISAVCGCTGFLAWSQAAAAATVAFGDNPALQQTLLPELADGRLPAGNGLSNALRHLAGLETLRLNARRSGEGYLVSGALPWISNIAPGHVFISAAALEDGGLLLFLVRGDADGLALEACPPLAGLNGSLTHTCRLADVYVPAADVVAGPETSTALLLRLRGWLALSQTGLGLGIVDGCLHDIREAGHTQAELNRHLPEQEDTLAAALHSARERTRRLAAQFDDPAAYADVLRLRARTAELALRAATAALLHAGSRGYLLRHPAQRRLREAGFFAIVTPALKQLHKELSQLERGSRRAA